MVLDISQYLTANIHGVYPGIFMKIAKGLWRPFQGNFGHVSWEKTFVGSIRTYSGLYPRNIKCNIFSKTLLFLLAQ